MKTFYELRIKDTFWGGHTNIRTYYSKKRALIGFKAERKRNKTARLVKVTETTIPHRPNK